MKYVYSIGIVDDFTGFTSFEKENFRFNENAYQSMLQEVRMLLIKHTYWEGDGHFEMFPVLDPNDIAFPHICVIIKQSNNGSTFVVSPIRLHGMNEYLVHPDKNRF